MNRNILAFIFMAIFSLTSCKKEIPTYVINGNIKDVTSNTALGSAEVKIEGLVAGNSNFELIENTFSTNDGTFNFSLERSSFTSLKFTVYKDGFYIESKTVNINSLSTENANEVSIDLYQKSVVKINFINIDGEASDKLIFIKQKGKTDCAECCEDEFSINGAFGGTVFCANNRSEIFKFLYSSTGQNPELHELVTNLDTNIVNINY